MTVEVVEDTVTNKRWRYTYYQQGCSDAGTPTTVPFIRSYKGTRTKVSRPGWAQLIRKGINATNKYSRTGYTLNVAPGFISWNSVGCSDGKTPLVGYIQGVLDNSPPTSLDLPTDISEALNVAKARFASSVQSAQTHMSGGVFLGELKETIHMIRAPGKAMQRIFDEYLSSCGRIGRRYRGRRVKRLILENDLYDNWLHYQLGIAPLLSETKTAAEALSRLINGDRPTKQVRGHGSVEQSVVTKRSDISVAGGLAKVPSAFVDKSSVKVYIRGAVKAKCHGPVWTAMDIFGFTSEQFVPTLWELLPFSFVTDYFSNVGDILSATYTDFSGLYWSSQSIVKEQSRSFQTYGLDKNDSFNGSISGNGGSWTLSRKSMSRTHPVSFVPSLAFSLPGSPYQATTVGALLAKSRNMSASLNSLLK